MSRSTPRATTPNLAACYPRNGVSGIVTHLKRARCRMSLAQARAAGRNASTKVDTLPEQP